MLNPVLTKDRSQRKEQRAGNEEPWVFIPAGADLLCDYGQVIFP